MNRINQFYKVYIFIAILLSFLMVPNILILLNPLSPSDGISSLSSSSIESPETGICRPEGNIRNEWGDGETSDYTRIADEVVTPDPGDGISNSHAGNYESKIDIFDMTTIDNPNLHSATAITIHLYCECRITRFGLARIQCSFRFGSNGEWSTSKSVTSPFSLAWKAFTWNGLSVSRQQLNILQIKLRAYIDATGWGGWVRVDVMYVEASYYERLGEKIGVFMWSSEVGTHSIITEYKNVLINKGYYKFFEYEDPDIDNVFNEIDLYEIGLNTIFFHFYGHGEYDNISDNSYWYYRSGLNITSERLRELMDTLEAERKGFLIDACYSEGFVDDFQDEPYIAMSSASKYLTATGSSGGGVFSSVFWYYVQFTEYAVTAFEEARQQNIIGNESGVWPWQDPQIADHSTNYDFFA